MKNWLKNNRRMLLTGLMIIIAAIIIYLGASIMRNSNELKMVHAGFISLEEKYGVEIEVMDYDYTSTHIRCEEFRQLSVEETKEFFAKADDIIYYNLRGIDTNLKAFKDYSIETEGLHVHVGDHVASAVGDSEDMEITFDKE